MSRATEANSGAVAVAAAKLVRRLKPPLNGGVPQCPEGRRQPFPSGIPSLELLFLHDNVSLLTSHTELFD